MNKRNYQKELDRIIQKRGKRMPRVLLHSCCGPCSSAVLEYLTQYFDVTLLWYNPNVYPKEEFDRRFKAQVEIIEKMGLADRVSVLAEPWKSEDYYARIKGLEAEPEGGRRCAECFRVRLLETARLAKHYGFDYFCTTLTLSRHKNAELINTIGEEIGRAAGVSWLPSDFKKRDGENRSVELSEQYGIYRQLYCGCEFSLHRRENVAAEHAAKQNDHSENEEDKTRVLCAAAVIGAAYAVMTIALAPISYGAVQFRVSEALCIMPLFIPGTAWGLATGCVLANLLTGNIFDIIFGSLATLAAAFCTAAIGRRGSTRLITLAGCMMPVVFNAVVVGAVITQAYNGMDIFSHLGVFTLNAAQVGLGELGVMLLIGYPLARFLPRQAFFSDFVEKCK